MPCFAVLCIALLRINKPSLTYANRHAILIIFSFSRSFLCLGVLILFASCCIQPFALKLRRSSRTCFFAMSARQGRMRNLCVHCGCGIATHAIFAHSEFTPHCEEDIKRRVHQHAMSSYSHAVLSWGDVTNETPPFFHFRDNKQSQIFSPGPELTLGVDPEQSMEGQRCRLK